MERVRIEPWALICPAKVKADACSIGGNTLRICSYIRKVTYVCSRVSVCLRTVFVTVCTWLDVERINWPRSQVYTSASCLPGVVLVSVRASQSISHGWLCLTFCLLGTFVMFSTLLGLTEIKNYTISWFDFFAKNISPTLFCIFWFL